MKPVPLFLSLLALLAAARGAQAACKIEQVGQLAARFEEGRLIVPATMNGVQVRLVLDTGAPMTVLTVDAARRLHLDLHSSASGLRLNGIGGEAQTMVTTVKAMDFGHFHLSNQPVPVAGHLEEGVDGVVGRDMFQDYDVDIDIPGGLIRLLHPGACADADMPFWAKGAYSEAPLKVRDSIWDNYRTDLMLNGRSFPAVLDTGTSRTTVTVGAAGMVGVTLTSQGSTPAGDFGGLGPGRLPSFSGLFRSVGVGEEKVQNTRIFVADLWKYNKVEETGTRFGAIDADPNFGLIGLDFFRSHHLLISNSHHKLYFTYEGGPVFLPAPSAAAQAPPSSY